MEYEGVMVFSEQQDGKIHPVSFELLSKGGEIAAKLGTRLAAFVLGSQISGKAKELIHYGAEKVFVYDHPSLEEFDPIRHTRNIVRLLQEQKPEICLFGATPLGRSIAPRVAGELKTGLTADCIDLDVDEDRNLIQIRPAFTGNILAYIKTKTKPQMSTVRYRVFERGKRDPTRQGKMIEKDVEVIDSGLRIIEKKKASEINLADADIIVSCGRGLKKPEDLSIVKKLADLLGGAVGTSRPLVDDGWIGKEHQVGFSGNTVKPKLYIACGISGSPQHLAGMRNSDTIIAINTDPSAPIFRHADYGIIGDFYDVVPKLIKEIERIRRRQGTER